MKISFENLGAIKKVDLDLSKKLTLLCGPNGTGKTYVSYVVYGYFENLMMANVFSLKELIHKKKIEVELDSETLFKVKRRYASLLDMEIPQVFGMTNNDYFLGFKAENLSTAEEFKTKVYEMEIDSYETIHEGIRLIYNKKAESNTLSIEVKDGLKVIDESGISGMIHNALIGKYICNQSIMNAYILPVERNSVYTFATNLAVNQIEKDGRIIAEDKSSTYPKPIKDALATAINLKNIKRLKSEYASLADDIEQDILGGKVSISDDGELLFSPQNSETVNLPIHLSASIIKNLSGLLVYLRHQAKKNDLLIIDEPELGLHPDNQVRLARIFARIINAGIRLMVSTHSDYIIKELNNLIMLSSNTEAIGKIKEKLKYKSDEYINKSDISVYLFQPSSKDSSIVKVDDNGFEIETIDKAICDLNQRTDDIYYALRYGNVDEN